LNPSGQIPVLVEDDGVVLTESNAILHYLAEGSTLLPPQRMARAQVLRWMFWEQYTHEPSVASARYIVRYLGRPAEHEQVLQRRIAGGHEALAILEQHLASRAFLVGDHYSIADIALYAYTHVADEGLIDLAAYPAVRAWLARVRAEPGHVTMQA
jgi:glutathione S-transferase